MTTVQPTVRGDHDDVDPALLRDLDDLRRALALHAFPGDQDDLIAGCLGRGEPARVVSRLARLTRERTYTCPDEVLADVVTASRTLPGPQTR